MKSIRLYKDQLTGVRLAAVNSSLWSIAATVSQRAQIALSDAAATYRFPVRAVLETVYLPSNTTRIGIPLPMDRVMSIRAVTQSLDGSQILSDFKLVPTMETTLIQFDRVFSEGKYLRIEGEFSPLAGIPEDLQLAAGCTSAIGVPVTFTGANFARDWPPTGYLEMHNSNGVTEIAMYSSVDPQNSVFVLAKRGLFNTSPATIANNGTLSYVPTWPPEAEPVIMAEAEANMYAFWVGHRALYDQWTALAGLQAIDVGDLLAMVRTLEDKANRRYKRVKGIIAPGRVQVRVRDDY